MGDPKTHYFECHSSRNLEKKIQIVVFHARWTLQQPWNPNVRVSATIQNAVITIFGRKEICERNHLFEQNGMKKKIKVKSLDREHHIC